jgi:hypothetical protein
MSTYREMAVPSSSARDLLQQRSTTRIRTLVVDDTMDILSTVCALLEQHPSIDVIGTAANGL